MTAQARGVSQGQSIEAGRSMSFANGVRGGNADPYKHWVSPGGLAQNSKVNSAGKPLPTAADSRTKGGLRTLPSMTMARKQALQAESASRSSAWNKGASAHPLPKYAHDAPRSQEDLLTDSLTRSVFGRR